MPHPMHIHKYISNNRYKKATEIRADIPIKKAPVIIKTYYHGKTRMYLCEGRRRFIADKYDEMFVPKVEDKKK